MAARGIVEDAPFLGYVTEVEATFHQVYEDFSRCTRGFEDWIVEACRNPYDGVCSLPPRHVSDRHTFVCLEDVLQRFRSTHREALLTDAGDEREETCESPTKKARRSPDTSPWAAESVGNARAPVASPCRNAARLGPVPKDPLPRNMFAKELVEEDPPRELSSPKKRLRDRPSPPSQTMTTCMSEPSTALVDKTWQHKALFNPPPAATTKAKVAAPLGKTGLFGCPTSSASSSSPAQRTRLVGTGTSAGVQNEGAERVADMVKRIEGSAPTTQDTPVSVFDRIRLFENTRSSPNLRQVGNSSNVIPSLAAGAGLACSSSTSTTSANANTSSAIGSTLVAPVKPKELFRNPSESAFRSAIAPSAPSSSVHVHTLTKSASSASMDGQHVVTKESLSQKAAPSIFDNGTSSAPPSLFSGFSAAGAKKKAQRRSAVDFDGEVEVSNLEPISSFSGAKADMKCDDGVPAAKSSDLTVSTGLASGSTESAREPIGVPTTQASVTQTTACSNVPTQQRVRPAVPLFSEEPHPPPQRLDPCMELRQMAIAEKCPEENYEISEHGGDSDAEETQTRDRSHKHVPKWCENYLDALSRQCDIDPDTIFGPRVPRCVLDDIFTDDMYKEAGKNRPKRARGSSGDWRKDQLARKEISDYKSRMGHARSWKKEGSS